MNDMARAQDLLQDASRTAAGAGLEAFWMPFTANAAYKALARPRLMDRAEGMFYYTHDTTIHNTL